MKSRVGKQLCFSLAGLISFGINEIQLSFKICFPPFIFLSINKCISLLHNQSFFCSYKKEMLMSLRYSALIPALLFEVVQI